MTSLCLIAITSSSNDQQILNSIVLWLLYVIIYVIYIYMLWLCLLTVPDCRFLSILPGSFEGTTSWWRPTWPVVVWISRACSVSSTSICQRPSRLRKKLGLSLQILRKTMENKRKQGTHICIYIYTYTQVMHLYVCISSCSLLQLPFWGLPHFHTQVQQNFEQRPSDARTTHTALDELAEQVWRVLVSAWKWPGDCHFDRLQS